jgi:Flp pilus assembly protein TadG
MNPERAGGVRDARCPIIRRALACLRRLRADNGVASIELAILIPLMVLVLGGFSEIFLYYRATAIIDRTAYLVANAIGQRSSLDGANTPADSGTIGAYWSAALLMASPLPMLTQGAMIVSVISDKNAGTTGKSATPTLTCAFKSTWNKAMTVNSALPASLLPSTWPFYSNEGAVAVEVFYNYQTLPLARLFWANAPTNHVIYKVVYVKPRHTSISVTNCA